MNTTDIVRRMFTGSVLRVVSLSSTVLVSFFMMPFLVHNLGDTQYGLWILVGSIVGFYGFFDFGLATAVGRYTASAVGKQDYEYVNRIINTALLLFGGFGAGVILLSCLSAIISFLYISENSQMFAILISIIGINVGLQFPLRTFSGVLTSQMRFDLLVYVELLKLFIRSTTVVYFISRGHGVIALAVISIITEILGNCLEFYFVKKHAPFIKFRKAYFSKPLIKQFIQYSWAVFVTNMSEMGRCRLIPLFVTGFLGLKVVVIYGIALRILEYFELLIKNCIGFIMPVLSRFEGENNSALIKQTFEYATLFSVITVAFISTSLVFYGYEFISVWMGEKYDQAYNVLLIMLIPMSISIVQIPTKDLLMALSKHNIFAALSFGGVASFSFFGFIIGSSFGLNGISYAVLIGLTLFEMVKPYYAARALRTSVLHAYGLYIIPTLKTVSVLTVYHVFTKDYLTLSFVSIIFLTFGQVLLFGPICYFFIIPKHLRNILNRSIIRPTLSKVLNLA